MRWSAIVTVVLAVVGVAGTSTHAWGDEPATEATPIAIADVKHEGDVDFEREILPLLNKNCLACHNRGKAESELVLETPQTILKGGASGAAVVPGKSDESLLLLVASRQSEPFMPPADDKIGAQSFSSEELGLIKLWIDQGARGEVRGSAASITWQPLPPGVNPILAVAVSEDGQYAACGRANQIFVYHLPSSRLVCRLTDPALVDGKTYTQPGVAHLDLVQSLAFSPDGMSLASGGYREVKLWRRPENVVLRTASIGGDNVAVSAKSSDGKWLATAGQDNVVRLWDLSTGQPGPSLSGSTAPVSAIAFRVDGARVYAGDRAGSIRVWDVASAQPVGHVVTPSAVLALAPTEDPNLVAAGGADGVIRLWGTTTAAMKPLATVAAVPTTFVVSADDRLLAVGLADGVVQLLDRTSGQAGHALASLGAATYSVAISADGKLVAAAASNRVAISDVASGAAIVTIAAETPVTQLAFDPQAAQIALAHFDGAVSVWDFDLAAKTATRRAQSPASGQPNVGLAYSPDGSTLYIASADGAVSSWPKSLEKPSYSVRPDGPSSALDLTVDGKILALGGTDGQVRLINAADGAAIALPAPAAALGSIESLRFARDGRRLAAVTQDQRVVVFDFVSEPAPRLTFAQSISPGSGPIAGAIVNGDTVLEIAADRNARTWSLSSLGSLAGHTQGVTCLVYSPAVKALFSGSADGTVRQWDLAKRAELRKLELGAPVTSVAVRPDGSRLAASAENNLARLWQVSDGAQVAEFMGDFRLRDRAARATAKLAVFKGKADALAAAVTAAEKDLADKQVAAKSAAEAFPPTETAAQEATTKLDVATKAKTTADQAAADSTAKVEAATKAKADADKLAGDTALLATATADAAAKAQAALDAQTQTNATLVTVAQAAKAATEKLPGDAALVAGLAAADKAVADSAAALETAKNLLAMLSKVRDEKATASKEATDAQAESAQALTDVQAVAKTATDAKAAVEKTFNETTAAAKTATDARDNAKRLMAETQRGVEAATIALPLAKTNLELAQATFGQLQATTHASNEASAALDRPLRSVSFSLDGKLLAIGGDDQSARTYDAEMGRAYGVYTGGNGAVSAVAFTSVGELVSLAADGTLSWWDQFPTWTIDRVLGPAAGAQGSPGDSLLTDRVLALAFSPDGRLLATGGGQPSRSGEIRLWNVADGAQVIELAEPHSDTVFGLEFSGDGRYLASAAADKFVKVFDAATGKMLRSYEGHTHHALGASWKFDGRLLASGGADGVVKIWNFDTGEQERTIRGYGKEVTSVGFVGVGPMLVTSSGDRSVKLQNADDGKTVRDFGGGTDFIYAAKATPDGSIVIAGGQDSVLKVWNGADGKVLADLAPPEAAK